MNLENPKELINKCRYPGDKNLQEVLLKDNRIQSFIQDNKKTWQTRSDHNHQVNLSHSLEVTPKSSPYLFEIVDKCLSIVDIKLSDISVFIISSPDINAWCGRTKGRVTIGINSALINAMEFDEICFIVGHEFGHALYDHHKLPAYGISQGLKLSPSQLMSLMSWSRQSEISADRSGLLCSGSIEASVQALIKLSTGGIGAPVISFDVEEFENQLSSIDSFIDDNADLIYTTHPLNPFRVRALMEFSKLTEIIGDKSQETLSLEDIDNNIDQLIEKMNPTKIKKSMDMNEDIFILHAGYWVLSSDQAMTGEGQKEQEKELSSLADIVGEELVDALDGDRAFSYEKITSSEEFVSTLEKPEKCRILESLVSISRADGVISSKERKTLYEVAEILDMKSEFVDEVMKFLD